MSLESLFGRSIDAWTEGVVAALYLHDVEPQSGMFEPTQEAVIRELWEQLNGLPSAWASELCVEVLERDCGQT